MDISSCLYDGSECGCCPLLLRHRSITGESKCFDVVMRLLKLLVIHCEVEWNGIGLVVQGDRDP